MSLDAIAIIIGIAFLAYVWYKKGINITITKKEVHEHEEATSVIMKNEQGSYEQVSIEEAQRRLDEEAAKSIQQEAMSILDDYLGNDQEVQDGSGK